ncbi:MAG: alanine--tRNA ligase-related protein, partial [Planctomycetota bacterium]
TDVFTPLFDAIRKRTNAPEYRGTLPDQSRDRKEAGVDQLMIDVSYRVIADHLRCLTFAITDGAVPDKGKRGYVLRSILRRAVFFGRQYLDMHEPFLCDLVAPLAQHMGDAFPELRIGNDPRHPHDNVKDVAEIIREEEKLFLKTLDAGITLFETALAIEYGYALAKFRGWKYETAGTVTWESANDNPTRWGLTFRTANDKPEKITIDTLRPRDWPDIQFLNVTVSGKNAFTLHSTHGFPIELTKIIAEMRGLSADIVEYERLMREARETAKGKRRGFGPVATFTLQTMRWGNELVKTISPEILKPFGTTDDSCKFDCGAIRAKLLAVLQISDSGQPFLTNEISGNANAMVALLVFDKTCFYAEQGGQIGDWGDIVGGGIKFHFTQTLKVGDTVIHAGTLPPGTQLPIGQELELRGLPNRRMQIESNHTSTHILNWALREVLGTRVQQKGSLVDPEKTRFDFSHPKAVGDTELAQIEDLCNQQIAARLPVYAASREEDFVDQKEARKISTLRAVFGEKYPDRVRVVSVGVPITEADAKKAGESDWLLKSPDNPKWMKYSVEFCGGTHVKNTGDIEKFVLTHEEAVAKGIRRLVGISGSAARDALTTGQNLLAEVESLDPSRDRKGAVSQEPADRDLSTRLSDFQQRLSSAIIPLRTRHQINEKLAALQKILKEHEKHTTAAAGDAILEKVKELLPTAQTIHGVTVLVTEVPPATPDALRTAIDWVRNKTPASAVLLASVSEGKVTLLAGMSKTVVDKGLRAGDLIKEISPLVGGKGGGRPDMAQGGGTDCVSVPNCLESATKWITERLSYSN